MNSLLNILQDLSLAKILAGAGGLVLLFTLFTLFRSSGSSSSGNDGEESSGKKRRGNPSLQRLEPEWSSAERKTGAAKTAAADGADAAKSEKQKRGLFKLFSKSESEGDREQKNEEILSPTEPQPLFTHKKATDHFNTLVKPGPASDLKTPDVDELDQIFTAMLKAGAVTPKPSLVTNFEHQYLEKLRIWFGYRYYIYSQVSVGSVFSINIDVSRLTLPQRRTFAQKCHNMSFDFLLVEKSSDSIVCAIELDDPTHMQASRISRDRRLDKVCAAAGLPIFHITDVYQKPDLGRMKPMYMKIKQ